MTIPRAQLLLSGAAALMLAGCAHDFVPGPPGPQAETVSLPPADAAATARAGAIAADPAFARAASVLAANEMALRETLVTLNEIPAPPFGEGPRAEAFADALRQGGLADVRIDAAGNVIGRRPGTGGGRTVALIAHIDTVFPIETDVTVKREGARFTAPGIGDNTRGLVMLLALLRAMETAEITTADDVLFVGSVGEEGLGDLRGVRHLFTGNHGIDSVIAVDGGDMDRIVVHAVGSNRYLATYRGPGGHSYGAFGQAHPHHALARAIDRFAVAGSKITAQQGAKATYSVGRIGGGTSVNSIPFESWMEVDMRSVDPDRLARLDAAFLDAVNTSLSDENTARTRGEPISVEIKSVGRRPAGQGDLETPLLANVMAAFAVAGRTPTLEASSTDANIPISLGIPAVTISRGGVSRAAHSLDESWEAVDVIEAERIALLLVLLEAGFGSR